MHVDYVEGVEKSVVRPRRVIIPLMPEDTAPFQRRRERQRTEAEDAQLVSRPRTLETQRHSSAAGRDREPKQRMRNYSQSTRVVMRSHGIALEAAILGHVETVGVEVGHSLGEVMRLMASQSKQR